MNIKSISAIGLFAFTAISCDLGGVKSPSDEDGNNVSGDTGNTTLNTENITDSIPILQSNELLEDSIQGQPNEMVFQREDGLRIEWTKKNEDAPIQLNDVVMVNYKALIHTGEQYDSNDEIGEPVPLKTNIGMMVKGWEEGLLKMNVGDSGRIMIPAALGYGENGLSDIIPPNADLIVYIEIVEKIEPVELEEGVKVYTWKKNKNGTYPAKNQLITFDYFAYTTGEEGKLYDNSFKDRQPFSFKFENDNLMDGLHQGFSVIRADENAFIEIPSKLAYGAKGLVDLVPKNTDIVYDVRVLRIEG